MYLSELRLTNFRKYGSSTDEQGNVLPGLSLKLNSGLNLLVGENDSGKTAIIDAIKLVLQTHSYELTRLDHEDFHKWIENGVQKQSNELLIELLFADFSDSEAGAFVDWIGFDANDKASLKVFLRAKREDSDVEAEVKAGAPNDIEGSQLTIAAKRKLRSTYLRPLRDAQNDLTFRKGSRLSQILSGHEKLQANDGETHKLVTYMEEANSNIKKYFEDDDGKIIKDTINVDYLEPFSDKNRSLVSEFNVSPSHLRGILERLQLQLFQKHQPELTTELGLGSHNLLYIAAEFLHLSKPNTIGLRLGLIEEIEAHLHPQAQMRVIEFLENESRMKNIQLLVSTHSTILASKVSLPNLLLCKDTSIFPLSADSTLLEHEDYMFLERFLDSTKANLFFASGVIIVEGDAENLFLPAIAEVIGRPLHDYGISIVNVGSRALLRYAKIMMRREGPAFPIRVACITDLDQPSEVSDENNVVAPSLDILNEHRSSIQDHLGNGENVKAFVSPQWTLEYDLAKGVLGEHIHISIQLAKKIKLKTARHDFSALSQSDEQTIIDDAKREYASWKQALSPDDLAFKIYKPLYKSQASKAVAAQYLAKFIKEAHVKAQLLQGLNQIDEPAKYILDAIRYVTNTEAPVAV